MNLKPIWNAIRADFGKFAVVMDLVAAGMQAKLGTVWDRIQADFKIFATGVDRGTAGIRANFEKLATGVDRDTTSLQVNLKPIWDAIQADFKIFATGVDRGTTGLRAKLGTAWEWILGQLVTFKDRWNKLWMEIASGIRSAFSGVTEFVSGIIDRVIGSATRALNSAIGLINRAVSAYNSIPLVPDISTISQVSAPAPRLHTGGRVPGTPGTDQMAVLRAGETVGRSGLGDAQQWPSELRLVLADDQGDDLAEFMMDRGVHLLRSSQGLVT